MKGLLLKDFYIVRSSLLILAVTFLAVGVALSFLISPWALVVAIAVIFSFQASATVQVDKASQWNRFAATLPLSRRQVISSKYLLTAILGAGGILLGAAVGLVVMAFQGQVDLGGLTPYLCLAVLLVFLPSSVILPLSFVLDEEKSIVGNVLAYLASAGLFAGFILLVRRFLLPEGDMTAALAAAALLGLQAFALSWLFCPGKLSKRDI